MSNIDLGVLPKYFHDITFEDIRDWYWWKQRNDESSLCYGSACFLVAYEWMEKSWDKMNSFMKWLKKNNFKPLNGKPDRIIGAAMVWVNINTKRYKCQRPAIGYCHPIFGHPITPEEFKKVYDISRSYLKFNREHINL